MVTRARKRRAEGEEEGVGKRSKVEGPSLGKGRAGERASRLRGGARYCSCPCRCYSYCSFPSEGRVAKWREEEMEGRVVTAPSPTTTGRRRTQRGGAASLPPPVVRKRGAGHQTPAPT